MTFTAPRIGVLLVTSLLAVFSGSPPAHQGTLMLHTRTNEIPAPPPRTVEGVATTQAGKPLAHVTLYLFGLPPGQTDMIKLGDQSTVVTDDKGRFVWNVPPALPPLSDYIGVRSIACYALAAERGTARFRLALRPDQHGSDTEQSARELLQEATRSCETKWLLGGAHPVFCVVVPDTSDVQLTVRGPGGQPLREQDVQVIPVERSAFYGGAIVYTSRTDAGGQLRLRCFPGSQRFQVLVPGTGFGFTGIFEAKAEQMGAPSLPPLAPFASLSGTVAPALVQPGAAVHQDDRILAPDNLWYVPRAAVAADGRWTLSDVLPGQHRLVLENGHGESEPVYILVQPGENKAGIALGPKQPAETLPVVTVSADAPSVQGRVTDAGGRPAAGADVFAVCSSGFGRGQKVLIAKTDDAGRYIIPGLPADPPRPTNAFFSGPPRGPSVHLVARQPGFGLAVADGQSEPGGVSGRWQDIERDLVLPAPHSGLTVRVLQNGKPVSNILVALAAQGENSVIPDMYRESDRGEAAKTLRSLLSPSAKTGPDGAVRFQNLTPGLWDITANRMFPAVFGGPTAPFNVSTGVAVKAGESRSYTVSLLPTPGEVAFRVLGPGNILPLVGQKIVILQTARNANYGNLSLTPGSAGNDLGQFVVPGLFQVTARFGDKPLNVNALAGPYYEGTAWVAVSAATASSQPVSVLTKRVGPASIHVRLVDAQGKPLSGTVTVGDPFKSALYAASVDANGEVTFANMPLSFFPYTVTAHIPGRPERIAPSRPGSLLPPDAALIAGTGQPLPQQVRLQGGEKAQVTLGAALPGYVRLRLTGPFASAKGYRVEGRQEKDEPLTPSQYDPVAGEYLIGPLPAGPRTLRLFRCTPLLVDTVLHAGEVMVTVKAGQVVQAVLAPQNTAAQEALNSSPLTGIVLLPDGKTPAWGARAALFSPDSQRPIRMARTDTQGRLTLGDFWRGSAGSLETPSGNSSGPVVAAWLPGANGAVVVPFEPGHALRLVLPPAVALHGRVTVGGRSVLGLPSQFQIRAAYQGKGVLNEALTVDTTAQADGTWTLAGLTPGTYQVQAARDSIWLSGTQTLTVGAETLPEMTLDIAPPGLPVILSFADQQGQPLRNQSVKIMRPFGPLTDEIWPDGLTTDASGHLRVDGLEAGHHTAEGMGFDVPAWSPSALPAARRIVLPIPVANHSRP